MLPTGCKKRLEGVKSPSIGSSERYMYREAAMSEVFNSDKELELNLEIEEIGGKDSAQYGSYSGM